MITFDAPASVPFDAPALLLNATTSSGLRIIYAVVSGPGVITGNVLRFTGAGEVLVEASQPGSDSYSAATPVRRAIRVEAQLAFLAPPENQLIDAGDTSALCVAAEAFSICSGAM